MQGVDGKEPDLFLSVSLHFSAVLCEDGEYSSKDTVKEIAFGKLRGGERELCGDQVLFPIVKFNHEFGEIDLFAEDGQTLIDRLEVLAKLLVKEESCLDLPVLLNDLETVFNRIESSSVLFLDTT